MSRFKDYFGRSIEVGDTVVFIAYGGFKTGKVKKLCKHRVKIGTPVDYRDLHGNLMSWTNYYFPMESEKRVIVIESVKDKESKESLKPEVTLDLDTVEIMES